jgi:hypothetical protein
MGVYELEEGKEVNTRGVWKAMGKEEFMCYGSNNTWVICTGRETMEAGKAAGCMWVASTALTPDKITEGWHVYDGKAWVDAPKVRARVCTAEEARAEAERLDQERQREAERLDQERQQEAERLEQERQRAMALAKQARRIKLEGQEKGGIFSKGDPQQDAMGVYELEEGKEVNARGVWKATGKERFMFYASNNQWWTSDRESMEAGWAAGCMWVASTALTPDKITETWEVYDGKAWVDAPKVRARLA